MGGWERSTANVLLKEIKAIGKKGVIIPYGDYVKSTARLIWGWWSFSWAKGNLNEIFPWYEERKKYIKLHPNSRKTLESILGQIKIKLEETK